MRALSLSFSFTLPHEIRIIFTFILVENEKNPAQRCSIDAFSMPIRTAQLHMHIFRFFRITQTHHRTHSHTHEERKFSCVRRTNKKYIFSLWFVFRFRFSNTPHLNTENYFSFFFLLPRTVLLRFILFCTGSLKFIRFFVSFFHHSF